MKKRIKKQRRKILISVISVLLAAWIVVSVVFSFAVLKMELNSQFIDERYRDSEYFDVINGGFTYDLFTNTERMRQTSLIDSDFEGDSASGVFDTNFQTVVFEKDTGRVVFNSSNSIVVNFYGLEGEADMKFTGFVNYGRFRSSVSQKQLSLIERYLTQGTNSNGERYYLIVTEFYGDDNTSEIIPKTVEIYLSNELNRWHLRSSVIETLSLNPQEVDGLPLISVDYDRVNVLPREFVLGEFSSGDILPDAEEPIVFKYTTEYFEVVDNPKIDRTAPFIYVYHNVHRVYTETEPHYVVGENGQLEEVSEEYNFYVKYIKRINLLAEGKEFIAFGLGTIFVFFVLLGISLSVLLVKTMENQFMEEQKRREVTNALAHDIKTPLFIIEGYAQSLKENINADKHPYYVERIIERTKEVNTLVHKMLDFSRLDSATYNPVMSEINISELLLKVSGDFDKLEDNKSLKLDVKDNVSLYADSGLMERALTNLLENAVKYSEPQTVIAVELCEKSVSFTNVTKNIAQENLKRLTEPYFRMDKNRNTKGNGLGLAVVKSICEIHGFDLDISLDNDIIRFTIGF